MDYQNKTRRILKDVGAFVDGGHFVYNSGHHGDFYINKDALYVYPKKLDDICVMLTAVAVEQFNDDFDVVLAPAIAGIILGQNVAYNISLERSRNIFFAYADKHLSNEQYRTIRRGYGQVVKNKKVLLVDDIVSTGSTLVSMAQAVMQLGGEVVGAAVICDRGHVRNLKCSIDSSKDIFNIPIAPLVELDLQTFKADNCPLCRAGRPIDMELGEGGSIDLFQQVKKVQEDV